MGKATPKYNKEELLASAPVPVSIRTLAIPAIIGIMIMAIYNFVDTLFIGMLKSATALSAVGIAFPIMALMTAVGQVLGVGAAASIGRYLGAQRKDKADQTASTVILTSFAMGLIFMCVGLLFQDTIFRLFGASDAVLPDARRYGVWMFTGALFSIPNQSLNNIARAETNVKLSMIALSVGAILNVFLDPLFMFTFGWGIEGASIATTLSQAVSFAFIFSYFARGKSLVHLSIKNFRFSGRLYGEVLKTGAPMGVSQALTAVAVSITNMMAATMAGGIGDNLVAAYGVVLKVFTIGQYIIFGYTQGYQPIAAYAYGARNGQRFWNCYRTSRRFLLAYGAVVTALYLVLAKPLIAIFTPDPQIIEYGRWMLTGQSAGFIIMALVTLQTTCFQAIGRGTSGILLSSTRQGLAYIPLIMLLPPFLGVLGFYITPALCDVISLVVSTALFAHQKKRLEQEFAQAA
nr:MATE family efflux transporter [Maliibacterium massiliense]